GRGGDRRLLRRLQPEEVRERRQAPALGREPRGEKGFRDVLQGTQAARRRSGAVTDDRVLFAYHAPGAPPLRVTPSDRWRDWINAMEDRWANRCLPLLMANE